MRTTLMGACLAVCLSWVAVGAYSIAPDQLDSKQVYWGDPAEFERPGEVQYDAIVRATPEYKEISSKRIERGTGRYWILISQASERAVRSIAKVGEETEYDLIATQGYLGSLDPIIPAEDITSLVIKVMTESGR